MVIDLLGPSLESLHQSCSKKIDVKTVLQIAIQLIRHFSLIHEQGIVYRDVKPDNFLIGNTERTRDKIDRIFDKIERTRDKIYVIDFGLAKCYQNSKGEHIPIQEGKSLTGTARYASLAAHQGIEQSRRDDLESLGNVFIYLMKGKLPW